MPATHVITSASVRMIISVPAKDSQLYLAAGATPFLRPVTDDCIKLSRMAAPDQNSISDMRYAAGPRSGFPKPA